MIFSRKAIESFKTALAITIAYGIALHMDWEQPRWAAITIALASLSTIGQSLNNAIERIIGTVTAGLVTLLLVGLFGQDRWLYMLSLSAWIGLCTYLMGGKKFEQFWMLSGFATAIIAIDAGLDAAASFEVVMLRLQQTLLGLMTYTLVVVLLWPNDGYADFKKACRKLASTQQKLYRIYAELMHGQLHDAEKTQAAHTLRMQALQQQTQFIQLLEGVEKERYEVWEIRDKWASYREQVVALGETVGYWRESFTEIQALNLQELLPTVKEFGIELDNRLTQIQRMLADDAPTQTPQTIELAPNPEALEKLSAFQKAAFTVFFHRLQSLEPITRAMFDTLGDIKDFAPAIVPVAETRAAPFRIVPDLDRLLGSFRVVLSLWLCYLALIYVNPIPGGGNLIAIGTASAMAVALAPQLPIRMFMPALTGFIIFTALIYFFLMPQLSTFLGLGLLIFSVCFMVCYKYFAPQQVLFKGLGIVLFLTLINISNEQSYDFNNFINTSVMFYLIAITLAITANIPFSPRPEHAFLRLLSRFFRCSEHLISTMQKDPQREMTRIDNWKKAFYLRELTLVPNKLATWAHFLNSESLSGTSPAQIQALTINLQALTYRLRELLDARSNIHAERMVQELQAQELLQSIRSWQSRMQETFQFLSEDPTAGNSEKFHATLAGIMEQLEARIKETLNKTPEGKLNLQDGANFYRLLGAYRSVSEAMGDYVAKSDDMHWARWREAKF